MERFDVNLHTGTLNTARIVLAVAVASLAGCGSAKAPVDDDFAALAGLDPTSTAFQMRLHLNGVPAYGQTSGPIAYAPPPTYEGFTFTVGRSA